MFGHEIVSLLGVADKLPELIVEDIQVIDFAEEHVEHRFDVVPLCEVACHSFTVDILYDSVTRVLKSLKPDLFRELLNPLSVVNRHHLREK
jgi:hypothetical protein